MNCKKTIQLKSGGGAFQMVLDYNDGSEPKLLGKFMTPLGGGNELNEIIQNLKPDDEIYITVVRKCPLSSCPDSLAKTGE